MKIIIEAEISDTEAEKLEEIGLLWIMEIK